MIRKEASHYGGGTKMKKNADIGFNNKTGLQPVSRLVEQVHYFGGLVESATSLCCKGFAERQPYRTGGVGVLQMHFVNIERQTFKSWFTSA